MAMSYRLYLICTTIFLGLLPATAIHAASWVDKTQLTGFMSATYSEIDEQEYFNGTQSEAGINKDGSFQGTKVGININSRINNKLSVAMQLFAAREESNYNVSMDWVFLSYQVTDELTVRAGKIKYPVGLLNEYVSVGYTYPMIRAPVMFYSELLLGAQATREAYTGASVFWEKESGDWTLSADLFAGEVTLSSMLVTGLTGVTLKGVWNDAVTLQASTFSGTMRNQTNAAMNGQTHEASTFGVSVDWNNFVVYAETADVKMGTFLAGKGTTSYVTLGYRIAKFLPFVTTQQFEKGKSTGSPQDQEMLTYGFRYELEQSTALKIELGKVKTNAGKGLFEDAPTNKDADYIGISIDTVF